MSPIHFRQNLLLMKKQHILSLLAFLVLFSACSEEFLDKKPLVNQTTDTFFQTEDHALQATNATYSMMRDWQVHVFSYIGMTDVISDDADKGSTVDDATFLKELDDFDFDASNIAPGSVWSGYYRAIYRANIAIQEIPTIDMDEELRDRLVAENRFLRAYFYFNLVRWFGDVPLILRPLDSDEYEQARTPMDEVYAQIIDDFEFAAATLPQKSEYGSADLGRATRGAANAYLAKVYLTRENWTEAKRYAVTVANSGEYSLLPDYNRIFLPEGEHSSGSIFEVGAVALGTGGGGSQYNEVQGVRGTPNLGWGFNRPSDNLLAAFSANDPRREATVLFVGEVLPDGSEVVVGDPGVRDQRQNQKAWVPDHPGGNGNGPGNIRLYRYADLLLIAAEAYNEMNMLDSALHYANLVRARARGPLPPAFLPDIASTDQTTTRNAIWLERRLELAMEQQRWFDLVRQKRAGDAMAAAGKLGFEQGKHDLFPIPQSEIDLSGGVLIQNQGY